jgi:hypothetical protein
VNNSLKLSVSKAVQAISRINRFKSFINKLYEQNHASSRNNAELHACAKLLGTELGQILSTGSVACIFRSVSAMWEEYEAFLLYFVEAKCDCSRDRKMRCMYEGLHRKITSVQFLLDLGLMCDALQEVSKQSVDLQERDMY